MERRPVKAAASERVAQTLAKATQAGLTDCSSSWRAPRWTIHKEGGCTGGNSGERVQARVPTAEGPVHRGPACESKGEDLLGALRPSSAGRPEKLPPGTPLTAGLPPQAEKQPLVKDSG